MPSIDQRLIQSSKSCLECLRWCLVGPSELSSEISSGFIFSGYNYFMYQRKGARGEGETGTSCQCHRKRDLVSQLVKFLSPYNQKWIKLFIPEQLRKEGFLFLALPEATRQMESLAIWVCKERNDLKDGEGWHHPSTKQVISPQQICAVAAEALLCVSSKSNFLSTCLEWVLSSLILNKNHSL